MSRFIGDIVNDQDMQNRWALAPSCAIGGGRFGGGDVATVSSGSSSQNTLPPPGLSS